MLKQPKRKLYKNRKKIFLKKKAAVINKKKHLTVKKLNQYKRVRKNFKLTSATSNPTYNILNKVSLKESFIINIKIKPNNIFCTLKHKDKIIYILSAGKCFVGNISKKTLRYKSQLIIKEFFKKINSYLKKNNFFINIVGTKKIRALTLRNLSNYFTNKKVLININLKKCFNGCRPPKKKRKRQKGLRVFK